MIQKPSVLFHQVPGANNSVGCPSDRLVLPCTATRYDNAEYQEGDGVWMCLLPDQREVTQAAATLAWRHKVTVTILDVLYRIQRRLDRLESYL
jgi:hypothetical protein